MNKILKKEIDQILAPTQESHSATAEQLFLRYVRKYKRIPILNKVYFGVKIGRWFYGQKLKLRVDPWDPI